MGFRRRFIGFVGAVQILLTFVMFIMGSSITNSTLLTLFVTDTAGNTITNNAAGIPFWGGILILMCGAGNLVDAFTSSSKKNPSQEYLPFSMGTILSNLTAFITSALILGLFSWSVSAVVAAYVIPFSTVIIAASLINVFSLFALFADCFAVCMPGPNHPMQRPYYVDSYDGPPRNQVFKA